MTGAQLRKARALLGWPIATVATRSGLSADLLRSLEAVQGHEILTDAQRADLHQALFSAGVEIAGDDVRLRDKHP